MIERPWAFWRRIQYLLGLIFVLCLIGVAFYFMYGYAEPTCSDSIQNGEERGIDCGGVCERICEVDIQKPIALWAQSFKIVDGQYNAVAYVENRNRDIGSPSFVYTFRLFDREGLIAERMGTTVLPPDGVYPIFEGRIMTGGRIPTRTEISFEENILWRKGDVGREQFVLEERELVNADSKPRLVAKLRNTAFDEAQDVEVIATIFDAQKNPLTVARTFIEYFEGRSVKEAVFTWPEPIAKTLRSCEIPTDVVLAIDLSGSMNNDGGTPPEPITSVLTSAQAFVETLHTQDQIGIVTYATEAHMMEGLTPERERIAEVVGNLTIDPKEEQGSTNFGDALVRMHDELNSLRHNEDARKVGIILTDGLATAPAENPEQYATEKAVLLKSTDIELFTIGLGSTVNETFLRSIASSDAQYYKAPSGSDLDTIYTSITESICEDGAAVIEIIPKSLATFHESRERD